MHLFFKLYNQKRAKIFSIAKNMQKKPKTCISSIFFLFNRAQKYVFFYNYLILRTFYFKKIFNKILNYYFLPT